MLGLKPNVADALVVLDDQHLFEESLIEHSLDVFGCVVIGRSAVNRKFKCQLKIAFDCLELESRCRKLCGVLLKCPRDSLLLVPEKINRDCSRVV